MKRVIIGFILFAIINFIGWSYHQLTSGYYRYSSYHGTFTVVEMPWGNSRVTKATNYALWNNEDLKKYWVDKRDSGFYRLFPIQIWKFWYWGEYVIDWRYRLPYMDWEEIRLRRKNYIAGKNNRQDF